MRNQDTPIATPRQDLLGRARFATSLAQAIVNIQGVEDGFVIALLGEWGAGKTSTLQLILRAILNHEVLHHLNSREPAGRWDYPRVEECCFAYSKVEPAIQKLTDESLNPDLWERNNRAATFKSLCESDAEASDASSYYDALKVVRTRPQNLIIRFSPWLLSDRSQLGQALLVEVARSVGDKLGRKVADDFAELFSRFAELSSALGAAANLLFPTTPIGAVFSQSVQAYDRILKQRAHGSSLETARDQLRRSLSKLHGQKIIVVIDDLDRLTSTEAGNVVSAVKGLLSLPNILFILSYEPRLLAAQIGRCYKVDGNEYLKKIVQYPVHLPPISPAASLNLLNSRLSDIRPNPTEDENTRLAEAWFYFLRYFLKTPRDVFRLLNGYSMAMAGRAKDIDPVDMLVLEAIRVELPDLYAWIRANLDILVS